MVNCMKCCCFMAIVARILQSVVITMGIGSIFWNKGAQAKGQAPTQQKRDKQAEQWNKSDQPDASAMPASRLS